MKFNMGCGHNHQPGYHNVDAAAGANPDEVFDLESTPWPWADGVADEVIFNHSLEHMGASSRVFLAMMTELYRIMAPGGRIRIHVPHPRHDNFMNDPTHVRPITPEMLLLFDRQKNDEWQAQGVANSPLAHYTGVDFQITEAMTVLTGRYLQAMQSGAMTEAEVRADLLSKNNVAEEFRITLIARKPG